MFKVENMSTSVKKETLAKRPLLSLIRRFSERRIRDEVLKRSFDVIFSFALMALILPFSLVIALLIKASSKGPVIFKQQRLGKNNTIFQCYKFRTMYGNAEELLEEILNQDCELKAEWESHQKLKRDPRITSIGKFLRKTSLDELPQFWNVIKGELSIVGPRPYMVFQKKDLGNRARLILSIRPGITGLWQTSGRSLLPFHKRIELDADYVKKRTFRYDLKLIVKTIPALFCNKNAC